MNAAAAVADRTAAPVPAPAPKAPARKRPTRKDTTKQVMEALTGKPAPRKAAARRPEPDKSPLLAVAECVQVKLPKQGLKHKGRPVELTGRVAVEVKLPDGKIAWVRHLESPQGRNAAKVDS